MHIKNVVIVLQKILPFFPREISLGEQMEKKLKSAIAEETREDLKLLLQSYVPSWTSRADVFVLNSRRLRLPSVTRPRWRSSSPSGFRCRSSEPPNPQKL